MQDIWASLVGWNYINSILFYKSPPGSSQHTIHTRFVKDSKIDLRKAIKSINQGEAWPLERGQLKIWIKCHLTELLLVRWASNHSLPTQWTRSSCWSASWRCTLRLQPLCPWTWTAPGEQEQDSWVTNGLHVPNKYICWFEFIDFTCNLATWTSSCWAPVSSEMNSSRAMLVCSRWTEFITIWRQINSKIPLINAPRPPFLTWISWSRLRLVLLIRADRQPASVLGVRRLSQNITLF